PNRQRRERALAMALSLDLVREVEPGVIHLLRDDDHMIRLEAARTLAESDSPSTREALSTALADPHGLVQEEARRLLARFEEKSHEDQGAGDSVSSLPVEETVS